MLGNMAITFGTYMLADTLSNFIQHAPQKMDYGKTVNKFLGREVKDGDSEFWGTRNEHIVGVAAALALTDYASQAAWKSIEGKAISFASHPGKFLVHTYVFIAAGVALYCGADALFNPHYASQNRFDVFYQNLNSTIIGSLTALHEPFWGALALALMPGLGGKWLFASLIPATIAYATVKGVGWNDWGSSGLNEVEKRFNKIT